MKYRLGFVSNSSSSSFILGEDNYDSVFDLAISMIPDREFGAVDNKLIKIIEKARAKGMNTNHPIAFSSCNYDTYIIKLQGCYVIATCNNHDWNISYYGNKEIPTQLQQKGIKNLEDINQIEYLYDFWFPECNLFGRAVNEWYEKLPYYQGDHDKSFCKKCHHDNIFVVSEQKIVCPNCDKQKKGASRENKNRVCK